MSRQSKTDRAPQPATGVTDGFLFLSYNSRDRKAVQEVQQRLRSRDVATFLDRDQLQPGQPWFDALQEAIGKARAVAVFIGRDGLGSWQKREMELALDRQAREEREGGSFPVIPVVLPEADLEKAPGFLLLNTWIDLRSRIDDAGALDALAGALGGVAAVAPPAPVALCPYRALRAFREEDAPLFFGREAFAAELLEKSLSQRLVTVVGPSGSGKSSVVQAGLLPLLRRAHPPSATWDAVIFTPGKRPFHNLAAALVPIWETELTETQRLREAESLGNDLADGKAAVEATFLLALKKSSGTDQLLIVVDQFEELFTLTPETERRAFIKSLLEAADATPVTLVLTLRADFYGQAISLSRELSDRMQHGLVNLGPMTREELRRAIEQPAQAAGLEFESGLAERILNHVEEQPGNLPLLEFALTELWEGREGRLLKNERYDAVGGVEGAISKRAEEQFSRLTSVQQGMALRLMSRLVRVAAAHEEGTDTRQRVKLSELDEAMRAVAQSFADARLLVTGRNETTGEETVEVAHEALIRRWKRLQELINKDREFLLWRQRLGLMLGEWQRAGRQEEILLRGAPLAEAKGWLKEREKDLSEGEREFIKSSSRRDVTTRRRRRWAIATAAGLALVAVTSVIGWNLWRRSDAYQIRSILDRGPNLIAPTAAESFSNPKSRRTISEWTRALILTGHVNETEKVLAAARGIKNPSSRAVALASVAGALVNAGKIDEARDVAHGIEEPSSRAGALASVVEALVKAGKIDEAKRVANEARDVAHGIENPSSRDRVLASVAGALVNAGKIDEARDVAHGIEEPSSRAGALVSVVEALVKAGKIDEALVATRGIKDPSSRAVALASVAGALVKAGKIDEALAVARAIENLSSRAGALASVAEALVNAGKIDEAKRVADDALATARDIDNDSSRSEGFASVARALAKLRSYYQALEVAELCSSSGDKLSAYTAILLEYHKERNPELAKSLALEEE